MDSSKKFDNPSPEQDANILSKLFFTWSFPFFKYGYKNDLQIKDLYNCAQPDLSSTLGDEIEKNWDTEVERSKKNGKRPSLLRAIRKTFLASYSVIGIALFFQCVIVKMFQPIVLAAYIKFYEVDPEERDIKMGWILACLTVLLAFLHVLIIHHGSLITQRIGMRCRIACCSLMYRKLLRMNKTSLGKVGVGQLINLLSNDVQRFDMSSLYLHYIWIMPIQAILSFYIMFRAVGWAAAIGFATITIQTIPLQGYLSRLQGVFRGKIAGKTDSRLKLLDEIITGIQVIKMYAWEKPFEQIVKLARKHEINVIAKTAYIRGISLSLMVFTERFILFVILISYVLMGNRLSSDIVFSMAQLLNTVQLYMTILWPTGLGMYAEAKASVNRIEDLLVMDEGDHKALPRPAQGSDKGRIHLNNVSATWVEKPVVDTLINITLDLKPGSLCCIVGPVGAGKSSFLHLLLGELQAHAGNVEVSGEISYASQEPWLFASTIRNNILFGQPLTEERYRNVIRVCALEADFDQLPFGDKTLAGEKGAALSGGQKARVNLARSVYREADIYLFDDPLSAVDTRVGKQLFEECIMKYLNGKTRILVTHQTQYLKNADVIIFLDNGKVQKIGAYNELTEDELGNLDEDSHEVEMEIAEAESEEKGEDNLIPMKKEEKEDKGEAQETEELMEKGTIPASTYMEYFRAGGSYFTLFIALLCLIAAQTSCNSADLMLTYWTNMEEARANQVKSIEPQLNGNSTPITLDINGTDSYITTEFPDFNETDFNLNLNNTEVRMNHVETSQQSLYITIYACIVLCMITFTLLKFALFFNVAMTASRQLHNKMFNHVLQATMRFFDTNPSGRILNRFSKDMGIIDEILPSASVEAIQVILAMCGILTLVFIVTYWMIAVAIVLGSLFYLCQIVYLASAQDVKRLEGVTRAPVFSHVSASLDGMATIRSSHAQKMVVKEFDSLQDQHTSSWFLFLFTSETFGFYLDLISTIFFTLVTLQFLIFDSGNNASGNVGLVITQSLLLTGMVQFGIRRTADVASHMTSVERVLQYLKIDTEGPYETLPGHKPGIDWPKTGKITLNKVYLKYAPEEPPVLKNLNLLFKGGEKIGVVGRTGAGKSSIISSLFRLAEIEGVIEIDGSNTKNIGLTDLRSKISIIPQKPVLFSNTVRYNLDPFEKCDDKTLWAALEKVELKDIIESLDQRVSEGGSNFSAGQKQLLCLARAIVRNNRILIMDEATANVDYATDNLIQQTIRSCFKDCTVLTIAHRLATIMDSDKVLVMENGEAVEYNHAYKLLQNKDSYFSKMLKETGSNVETNLKGVAQRDYKSKFEEQIPESPDENDTHL